MGRRTCLGARFKRAWRMLVGRVWQSSQRQQPAAGTPHLSMPGTQLIPSFFLFFFIQYGYPAYVLVLPELSLGIPARLNLSGNVLKDTFRAVSPRWLQIPQR